MTGDDSLPLAVEALKTIPVLQDFRGDIVRLDAEAGTLELKVSDAELALRPAPVADLSANAFGFGRELFTGFRAMATRADLGASAFGTA